VRPYALSRSHGFVRGLRAALRQAQGRLSPKSGRGGRKEGASASMKRWRVLAKRPHID